MLVPVRVLSRGDVQGLISVADAIGVVRDCLELTVADLTGLGIQDAAVAAFVAGRAEELGAGEPVTLAESDYARR
jgi:ornithine cyclodeaminase/alanine dehydrogenase-like protein (mu-crystallin family)